MGTMLDQEYIDRALQAAYKGGAKRAWAESFDHGNEIGVCVEATNGRKHAVRLKLDRPFAAVLPEIEGFAQSWVAKQEAAR